MRISLPPATLRERRNRSSGSIAAGRPRLRRLPGVSAAGAARSLPLGSTIGDFGLRVDGYTPPPGTERQGRLADRHAPATCEAIGEQVVRGRGIDAHRHPRHAAGRL